MVELGKKYLGFNQNVKILIKDAYEFTSSCRLPAKSYDLICVDLYIGDKYPQKFETDQFLANLQKALNKNGVVIFNRLYYGDKRPQAEKFEKRLTKFFPKINRFFPEANIMFFCSWL
jgi:spermidine synthase